MLSLVVRGFYAQGDQFPGGHVHLRPESFQRLLAQIATPYPDRPVICPLQAGSAILSRGAEEADNSRAAVCAPLAFLQNNIFLIYPEFQSIWGSLPMC